MGVEESLEYHVMPALRTRVLVCVRAFVCMCANVNMYRRKKDALVPSNTWIYNFILCVGSASKRQLNVNTLI